MYKNNEQKCSNVNAWTSNEQKDKFFDLFPSKVLKPTQTLTKLALSVILAALTNTQTVELLLKPFYYKQETRVTYISRRPLKINVSQSCK